MKPSTQSELVQKGLPCPGCTSSDGFAIYDDGHGYCFVEAQQYSSKKLKEINYGWPDRSAPDPDHAGRAGHALQGLTKDMEALETLLSSAAPNTIKSRHLTATTARKWNYLTRTSPAGHKEQLAVYCNDRGQPIAIKVRDTGKDGTEKGFRWIGNAKKVGLFGKHLWGSGGKMLTITEGEIDALSMSQINDHKWPVVSVPNGAAEAAKAIANDLEWVNTFEKVILAFDMDTPGKDAAEAAAKVLPPGKAFIASLPRKDINECLKEGLSAEVTKAIWNARPYRPDGIVDARELTARCLDPIVSGTPWPWSFVTSWTYGRRGGEVYTVGAGTGVGKTDWMAEVVASTINGRTKEGVPYTPEGFAVFSYEAGAATIKKAIAGKLAGRRFHIPQGEGPDDGHWTAQELASTLQDMDQRIWGNGGKLYINDSFGKADWDAAKERIRFLAHSEGIKNFQVDPISALVIDAEDERKLLDAIVMEAAMLAQELNAKIYLVSHLTRPAQGPSHEEGGQVRLNQFRGSNGIGMSSSFVFGLERDQQNEDEAERTKTIVRVVKDRYTGNSAGKTRALYYDLLAGTLDEPTLKLEPGQP